MSLFRPFFETTEKWERFYVYGLMLGFALGVCVAWVVASHTGPIPMPG